MTRRPTPGLTPTMGRMLLASSPDDVTGSEGIGVELRSPGDYAVAKALERRGFGRYTHGVSTGDLYWNTREGLDERRYQLGLPDPDEEDEDD
ncbi:hypothetical protein W2_gp055 [Caulobacter phage W2]|uniref:Uncharacterized protein n=1 Tax=Caulobacter phage TMCBR4 TaxID=3028191 RepID=A0AAE9ZKZ2_9CAUD|nr:hypothetical protein TMCBR4_gp056 [Caulobacter phage TMCBR4]WDS38423.1 hypothetical protein W2_gp055 [Caulobacter phage W2]